MKSSSSNQDDMELLDQYIFEPSVRLTKKKTALVNFIDNLLVPGHEVLQGDKDQTSHFKKQAFINYEISAIFSNHFREKCSLVCFQFNDRVLEHTFECVHTYTEYKSNLYNCLFDTSKSEIQIVKNREYDALKYTMVALKGIKGVIRDPRLEDAHITAVLAYKLDKFCQSIEPIETNATKSNQKQQIEDLRSSAKRLINVVTTDPAYLLVEISNFAQEHLSKAKKQNFDLICLSQYNLASAETLLNFTNNLSLCDVSLTTKEKFQALAIGFLAVTVIALVVTAVVLSHGIIIPALLLLFKASAAAASATASSTAVNALTIGGLVGGVSVLGFFMPSYLRLRWARSDMQEKAAGFKTAVTQP